MSEEQEALENKINQAIRKHETLDHDDYTIGFNRYSAVRDVISILSEFCWLKDDDQSFPEIPRRDIRGIIMQRDSVIVKAHFRKVIEIKLYTPFAEMDEEPIDA